MGTTNVTSRERPVRPVKRLVLGGILAVAIGVGCFIWLPPPVKSPIPKMHSRSELALRDGRFYRAGDAQPFSGLVTDSYHTGELMSRWVVSNGLLEGLSEGWYTNGQKQVEEHFRAGVSHGLRTKWYPNGAKLSEGMIVEGQLHGTFQRWYESGVLSERIELINGQPNGLSLAYHSSGSLKARVKLEGGKILEQAAWPDGEYKE